MGKCWISKWKYLASVLQFRQRLASKWLSQGTDIFFLINLAVYLRDSYADLLSSGELSSKNSINFPSNDNNFQFLLTKICFVSHSTIVELGDNSSASLYCQTIQSHPICLLVKHQVSSDHAVVNFRYLYDDSVFCRKITLPSTENLLTLSYYRTFCKRFEKISLHHHKCRAKATIQKKLLNCLFYDSVIIIVRTFSCLESRLPDASLVN